MATPRLSTMPAPTTTRSTLPAEVPRPNGARALATTFGLTTGLLAVFAASRLMLVAAAFAAEVLVPREPGFQPGATGPILTSLTSWDGFYYLSIATQGYQADPIVGTYSNAAFAPLYPLLVGLVGRPFPELAGLFAVLVSNVALLAAVGVFVLLATPRLGQRRAALAAGLLLIHPFAWAFGMAYSESLFLLLSLATFLAAERGRRGWAGVLLGLAVLCRVQGVVLVLPLLVLLLRQDGWRPRPSQAWVLLAPLALVAFLAYIASITGSPTGYLDAMDAWGRSGLGGTAPDGTIAADFSVYQGMLVVTLLCSVFLLVFVRVDRLPPEYWLIPVSFMGLVILSGSLESVGRYMLLAFPSVWILARRRSRLARRAWPAASAALFVTLAFLSFAGYWVP